MGLTWLSHSTSTGLSNSIEPKTRKTRLAFRTEKLCRIYKAFNRIEEKRVEQEERETSGADNEDMSDREGSMIHGTEAESRSSAEARVWEIAVTSILLD